MVPFPRKTCPPLRVATMLTHAIALPLALLLLHASIGASANATTSAAAAGIASPSPPSDVNAIVPPFVAGRVFVGGVVQDVEAEISVLDLGNMKLRDVYGCCKIVDESCPDADADADADKGREKHDHVVRGTRYARPVVGTMPQFTEEQSLRVLQRAVDAWDGGSGEWPQMSLSSRIDAVERFLSALQSSRSDIVDVLMWEIGKNMDDAESEFDRTMLFAKSTIDALRSADEGWDDSLGGATRLFVRRAAIGIVLCLGPYNYPLNETYATLIPALLMGNVILLKIPTVGGLAHLLTMSAFAKSLPPGTIQFISGSGRITMGGIMETGKIDCLAFIGGSRAADDLLRKHPEPHRLKVFFQLEAKNMGIFLPDLFESGNEEELGRAISEAVKGSLSFNGQRCTALKLLFVPQEHAERFTSMMKDGVEKLSVGLPWEGAVTGSGKTKYSQITPLPNQDRVDYMRALINDASDKGAEIVNKNGGSTVGEGKGVMESTLMIPALLYPVAPGMRIWEEEQFGPVVPIAPYESLEEVKNYARHGKYGQQVSIFTSSAIESDTAAAADLVDSFSTIFGKINVNSQCGRSPDAAPFSGRRSSAMGVMSISESLREFSVPTVVSYKADAGRTDAVMRAIEERSKFLQPVVS